MITESPIPDDEGSGALYLEIIHKLIQFCEIDSSTEPASRGMNPKPARPTWRG